MRRGYASEPILLEASPVTMPAWERRKKRLSLFKIAALILAVIAGGVGLWLWQGRGTAESAFPASIRQSVGFRLLEPNPLPPDFAIDAGSLQSTAETVTFALTHKSGKQLVVTEQQAPGGFDFESFYEQFENRRDLTTVAGRAVMGRFDGADLASITDSTTWVLVRAPEGASVEMLEALAQSFKLVK